MSDLPRLLHALVLLHKLVQAVDGCDGRPVMQLPLLQPQVCRQGKRSGYYKATIKASCVMALHTACLCVPCRVADGSVLHRPRSMGSRYCTQLLRLSAVANAAASSQSPNSRESNVLLSALSGDAELVVYRVLYGECWLLF